MVFEPAPGASASELARAETGAATTTASPRCRSAAAFFLAFSSSWELLLLLLLLLLLCRRRERVALSLFDLWGEGSGGEKLERKRGSQGKRKLSIF